MKTLNYKTELPNNVKKEFGKNIFSLQFDKLITEIIKESLMYADKTMKKMAAAKVNESYILTEEAVRISQDLSKEASESIVRILQDDAIYYEHPKALSRKIVDLWGGEKYRAERFARTFTADVATATTVARYRQYGVRYMEFDAEIDDRTTDQCRCLNGTIFDLTKDSVDRYRPPLHQHCRSGLVPLTDSDYEENREFENRNFDNVLDNPDDVKRAFKNIDTFNDKYRVSKFKLDQDLGARIMFDKGFSVGISGPDLEVILKQTPTKTGTGLVDAKGNPVTSIQDVFSSIDHIKPTIEIPPETQTLLSDANLIKYLGKEIKITSIKGSSASGGYIVLDSGEQLYVSWLNVMRTSKEIKSDIADAIRIHRPAISKRNIIERKGHFLLD